MKRGDNMDTRSYDEKVRDFRCEDMRWIEYLEGVATQSENALRELTDVKSKRNLSPLADLM